MEMTEIQILGNQPFTWEGQIMGLWKNMLPGKVRRRQQIQSHLWGCSTPWLVPYFYCWGWFPVQGNSFSHGGFWLESETSRPSYSS